jgi:hypothetical protein
MPGAPKTPKPQIKEIKLKNYNNYLTDKKFII